MGNFTQGVIVATAFWNSLYREVLAGRGRYMKGKPGMPVIFWIWEGRYFGQWQLGAKNHYISWNAGVKVPFTEPEPPDNEIAVALPEVSGLCEILNYDRDQQSLPPSSKRRGYQTFVNNLTNKLKNEEWESYCEGRKPHEDWLAGRRTWEILGRPKIDKWVALEFERMERNTKLGTNNMIRLGKLVLKHRSYLKGMKEFFYGYTQACFLDKSTPQEIVRLREELASVQEILASRAKWYAVALEQKINGGKVDRSFTDDHYKIMQKGTLIGDPTLQGMYEGMRWDVRACGGVKTWRALYHKGASDLQKDAWVILLKLSKIELRQADKIWIDEVMTQFKQNMHIGLLTKVHDRVALMERRYRAALSVHPGMIEYHAKFKEECKWTFPPGMTLLSTIEEYTEEGAKMQHCVAGYFNQRSHIVSIRTDEGASTLELGRNGDNRQHRGYLNKSPPAANMELVKQFYSLNGEDIHAHRQYYSGNLAFVAREPVPVPFPIGEEAFDI